MESTGVFWKPIYNLQEGLDFTLLVVNSRHIKDAEWIADLLRHGLLQGSFIPNRPQRELRELVRYRRNLIREQSRVINRIQQVLEGANIKLSSVASDIMGVPAWPCWQHWPEGKPTWREARCTTNGPSWSRP
jgi:transposase